MRITKKLTVFLLSIYLTNSQISIDQNNSLNNYWEQNIHDYDIVFNKILNKASVDPSKYTFIYI